MPVLNPSAIESALAGPSRRRVWAHPNVQSHSLVVLTHEVLHVAPLAGTPKAEVVSLAVEGGDLDELLGPYAVAVEVASVQRVRLDLVTNSLVVDYAKGGGMDTSRLTVTFATPEAADACFTKLWRRAGTGLQLRPYRRDAWVAARAPLALLAAALVTAAALALTLSVFEDMASARGAARVPARSALEALLGWMDWRWVCGAGGIVAAVAQVWLYRRLTQPPRSLVVSRA